MKAKAIADQLVARLAPVCERIEIAGGVRRLKIDPHDIELICIPRFASESDLFGNATITRSLLEPVVCELGDVKKNGPRMKQVLLPGGIYLDLFCVLPPAQWGVIMAIRTGPSDYSKWLVTAKRYGGALPSHLKIEDGAVWSGRDPLTTLEERDFFKVLEVEYMDPERRCPPTHTPIHI